MPFEVTRENYIFYERESEELTPEFALRLAQRELAAQERNLWEPESIVQRDVAALTENGVLTLTGHYLVEMEIGKQADIQVFDKTIQEKGKKIREGGY